MLIRKVMKNNKKIVLLIVFIVIIILVFLCIFLNKNNNYKEGDNNLTELKVNNSLQLKKERYFKSLRIFDIQFVNQNGITRFTANLENESNEDFKAMNIEIVFKNEDGSEYLRVPRIYC